jgi:hypothetical protein
MRKPASQSPLDMIGACDTPFHLEFLEDWLVHSVERRPVKLVPIAGTGCRAIWPWNDESLVSRSLALPADPPWLTPRGIPPRSI